MATITKIKKGKNNMDSIIEYKIKYADNSCLISKDHKYRVQTLRIEIVNTESFINDTYHVDESEAQEIYLLLISGNTEEIQEYLRELTQNDDVPNLAQLSQRGEI